MADTSPPNLEPSLATGSPDGQIVGESGGTVTEWSGGSVIHLGGLPGSIGSEANSINDAGQAVGVSYLANGSERATEWSDGSVIDLGSGVANGINDAGQGVGYSEGGATEWSDGSVIYLGGVPGFTASLVASSINEAGQAVGYSVFTPGPPIPEPSTWAMMLIGFAGLAFAGYRHARRVSRLACR